MVDVARAEKDLKRREEKRREEKDGDGNAEPNPNPNPNPNSILNSSTRPKTRGTAD
jgi:hypothetical protein